MQKVYYLLELILILLFVSCAQDVTEPRYKIGVSLDNSDAWHDKMRDEIIHEAVLHPELKLLVANAYGRKEHQASQIDSLVDAGVDLLIVCVEDPLLVIETTNRAYDMGIPVVINARSSRMSKYTAYVGTDNYAVGELMAEYVLELAEKEKKTGMDPLGVLELLGKIGAPAVSDRYVGLRDSLRGKSEVKIVSSVCGDWEYDKAYHIVDSVLKVRQDVDVIVAQNDVMAMGASAAGRDNNPERDFHVLGVDALSGAGNGIEAVIDGKIAASITNVSRGDLLVQTACNILYGEPYEKDNSLQPVLVDQTSPRLVMRMTQEMNYESKVIKTLQMKVDKFWDETNNLKNKNIVLSFSLFIFVLMLIFSVFVYRYRLQTKREQEQNAQLMATQQEQLEKITAELERVRSSQSADEELLGKLRDEIEKHLDDSEYSVEMLAETLGVSRAQLFRRVKSLTGVTPLVMLKQIRLRKARQLLQYTDMTVQQVAYSVGYTLPSYFASNYKEMFGLLPSDERRGNGQKNINNNKKSRRR